MDYLSLCGIALGLSMDAFAVSITNGATNHRAKPVVTFKLAVKLALSFGFFQAFMPMLGWLIGKAGESIINAVDHWIALLLLSYLGIKMIIESNKNGSDEECPLQADIHFRTLMILSVATSIDALVTGVLLPSAVGASTVTAMLLSVGIIGLITFCLCFIGVYIGKNFGRLLSTKAELFGGIVLTGIGIKIFIEHMFM
ncbi:manganese efflux pump [Caproiciproducens galactitolivorans]|uniref:Putative manganese efflux pump MntP n=1 Tax=Caproiciproducens galactitolivorans TaxID=642589 RepID=A0A4Z0XYU4_9FIRM|nr:manganese efflux pump MntP family protein [Caproiciproducens galactitolivorans]QEY34008.1 manganese efflux pump [Caproiciproducens galactitolivorans]TGJ76584.1 putative manganese efflux pump MntP [Caproiciproducens galactitolivorans]